MEPTPTTEDPQKTENCPNCKSEITFKEKDGVVEYWDCPNCGKINLKKEQWKKQFLKPTKLPEVHINCNFCKNLHSEKCTDSPNPDTCPMYEENKRISYTTKTIMIVDAMQPTYFLDQYSNAQTWIKDGVYKTLKIDSLQFQQLLIDRFFRTFGKAPSTQSIKESVKMIEALARTSETKKIRTRVYLRINEAGEKEIWVDLCDKFWRSIKITVKGYEIIYQTPPMFRRNKHMQKLPLPQKYDGSDDNDGNSPHLMCNTLTVGISKKIKDISYKIGDSPSLPSQPSLYPYLMKLNHFYNLDSKDFFLTIVHMINTFFVDRPQTLLSVNGIKGSAKTSISEGIKKVLDPSETLTLDMPNNRDELLQNIDHHFYPSFDNVDYITHEFSNIFCRTLTGAGTFKRMLWTDDEEFIRSFLKSININGINVVVVREDLLDRALLVFALPFNGNRKTKSELNAEFNKILPYVLHDLYTLVSKVLFLLPETEDPTEFRMIDYAKIGCAVSKALGYDREYFIKIYREKLLTQIKEAIYNDTFGNVLLSFIEDENNLAPLENGHYVWEGSTAKLYSDTKLYAKDTLLVSVRTKGYPNASNRMSRQINDLTDAFSKLGIIIEQTRSSTTRGFRIVNTNLKEPEPKTESEKLEALRNFSLTERNSDGYINKASVTAKIQELELDYETAIPALRNESLILEELTNPNVWRVTR